MWLDAYPLPATEPSPNLSTMTQAVSFRDGQALFAHLVEAHRGSPVANRVVVPLEGGGASRVDAIERHGEIWIRGTTAIGPADEVDPEWALARNAATAATGIAIVDGECVIAWCLPIAWLTRDRIAQLFDEARSQRAAIREEFGIEDADDEEDEDEDDDDEEEEDSGED